MNSLYKWKTIKWSAALLALYIDKRLHRGRKRRPVDIALIDWLMVRLLDKPNLRPFSYSDQQDYLKVTEKTIYWHGTGRFQYNKKGGTVDVLARLIKDHGLKPFKDNFDVKQGEMISISLARQRMYARIYADMHVYKGAHPSKRYGSPRFWAYYFIMATNLHAIRELRLWSQKARRKQESAWREQGEKLWTVKVVKKAPSSGGQFFNNGSDIPGNYPILVGLGPADYHVLKTAGYVARYESRMGTSIPIRAFTHLEVPASKTGEVKLLLKKHGFETVSVFAFEQAEQLQSTRHFSSLVS